MTNQTDLRAYLNRYLASCQNRRDAVREWHPWRKEPGELSLYHVDNGYWIDLTECSTSAQTLDWIFQVAGKPWADDKTLAALVRALNELIGQGVCSGGVERGPLDNANLA